VLVEVDEAGSHNQTGGLNNSGAAERLVADSCDPISANSHVANGVQRGLWIDHAPAVNDNVVALLSEIGPARDQSEERNPQHSGK